MSNIDQPSSFQYTARDEFKRAYFALFARCAFTHMLTLSWNRPLTMRRARADLRTLHARVDERFYGRRFFRRPAVDRTLAVFIFEKCETHMHVHSLWKVPDKSKLHPFHRMFLGQRGGVWNDVVPTGSYALTIIDDHGTAGGYIMKDQHMKSDDSLIVWSDEFVTSRAK